MTRIKPSVIKKILYTLSRNKKMWGRAISRAISEDNMTTRRYLNMLEDQGYVESELFGEIPEKDKVMMKTYKLKKLSRAKTKEVKRLATEGGFILKKELFHKRMDEKFDWSFLEDNVRCAILKAFKGVEMLSFEEGVEMLSFEDIVRESGLSPLPIRGFMIEQLILEDDRLVDQVDTISHFRLTEKGKAVLNSLCIDGKH